MSKLAKQFVSGLVIMLCRSNQTFRGKGESFDDPSANCYSIYRPSSLLMVRPNAFVSSGIRFKASSILGVFCIGAYTKIGIGIIQSVMVSMIGATRVFVCKSTNKTMHPYWSLFSVLAAFLSHRVETLAVLVPPCKPLPLIKFLESMWADLRKLSLRELNNAVCFLWGCHVGITSGVALAGCLNIRQPHYIPTEI